MMNYLLPGAGSGTSLLRFIPVRSLRLAVAGRVDLAQLNQPDLQVLDLRNSPQAVISKPTVLPALGCPKRFRRR